MSIAEQLTEIRYDTKAEWLADRKNFIGSSEAAAILGWSKFSSPWAIWAKKTGKVDELPGTETEMSEWDIGTKSQSPKSLRR